jgi:hypothetical protein
LAGEILGAPVRVTGRATLDAVADGCRLAFDVDVKAQIPLVGQTIEKAVRPHVEAYLAAQDKLARDWLARP